jgi:PPOX class probable F420-dependent enzyme
MAPTFADVAKAKYVSPTTFTNDGRPKPTPIWVVPDGDAALLITEKNAWKVKRIHNTPRVTVAICDMHPAPCASRLLPAPTTHPCPATYSLCVHLRYTLTGHSAQCPLKCQSRIQLSIV